VGILAAERVEVAEVPAVVEGVLAAAYPEMRFSHAFVVAAVLPPDVFPQAPPLALLPSNVFERAYNPTATAPAPINHLVVLFSFF
jgi:hypothetical protein